MTKLTGEWIKDPYDSNDTSCSCLKIIKSSGLIGYREVVLWLFQNGYSGCRFEQEFRIPEDLEAFCEEDGDRDFWVLRRIEDDN